MQSITLKTTLGDIKIELFCEESPKASNNFLALCASGYYDKTIFHRNIPGFMIQGGDPTGTGKGGKSIYNTPNGKFSDEIVDALKHSRRGIVSYANSGPNSNGSQFFITYKAQPHLNGTYAVHGSISCFPPLISIYEQCGLYNAGKYTIFGHVIDGFDTIDKMERIPTGDRDKPLQEVRLNRVTIHANPFA